MKEGPKPYFRAKNIMSNFKYLWLLNGYIYNNIKKTNLIVHSSGKTPSAITFHALNMSVIYYQLKKCLWYYQSFFVMITALEIISCTYYHLRDTQKTVKVPFSLYKRADLSLFA